MNSEKYIGLDVHQATISVAVLDSTGKLVMKSILETKAATTIRKRMRAKLREVKQQLRKRMHNPVPQTGQWLKPVVQGYFNYYAVPGNIASLGVFRDRVLVLWWRTIRRRSQKRRISWRRILELAQRWIPQPRALHPFPDARFAATHPR